MISVVVPTHNRSASAVRLAHALDRQEYADDYECVFVLDGCSDDTKTALQSLRLSIPIILIETEGLGAAAARNVGADAARGDLLHFMDDDVVPNINVLTSHACAHVGEDNLAVLGPYPYAPEEPVNALDLYIRDWWQMRFRVLANPSHKFTYRDCLTGNISLHKRDFDELSGFDTAFVKDGREDYEFGVRLLKSGRQIKFAPDALAYHYARNKPSSLITKWHTFGRADVLFVRKHPEVFYTLPLRHFCKQRGQLHEAMYQFAGFIFPMRKPVLRALGRFFDRRIQKLWNPKLMHVWSRCQNTAYLLGLMSGAGGPRELEEFFDQFVPRKERPRCTAMIKTIDFLDEGAEIHDTDICDKLYVLGSMGDDVLGWVGVPVQRGQDSLASGEVSKYLSESRAWDIWCEGSVSVPERVICNESEPAWQSLVKCIDNMPALHAKPEEFDAPEDSDKGIVTITPGKKNLVNLSSSALSNAKAMAVMKDGELINSKSSVTTLKQMSRPDVGAVICPVLPRDVWTREQELYTTYLGLQRVISWRPTALAEWMHPSRILLEFGSPCYRLVIKQEALASILNSIGRLHKTVEDLTVAALHALIRADWEVVFEPRAVIWTDLDFSAGDVQIMAVTHVERIMRAITHNCNKEKDIKGYAREAMVKIAGYEVRHLLACSRRKSDWPISCAIRELLSTIRGAAGMKRNMRGVELADTSIASESEGTA